MLYLFLLYVQDVLLIYLYVSIYINMVMTSWTNSTFKKVYHQYFNVELIKTGELLYRNWQDFLDTQYLLCWRVNPGQYSFLQGTCRVEMTLIVSS